MRSRLHLCVRGCAAGMDRSAPVHTTRLIPPLPHHPTYLHIPPVLAQAPEEADARAAKAIAAVLAGDYEGALQTTTTNNTADLDLERAYALYRLNKGEEALAVLAASPRGGNEEAYLHLKGQTLFKLGLYAEACEAFVGVAELAGPEAAEGDPELMTNVYAAFVAAGKGREALERFPVDEVRFFCV